MLRTLWAASLIIASFLCPLTMAQTGFAPHVIIYAGRIPGYGEALAEIVEETGTKAIVADSDAVLRSLAMLPQTRCILIAALNPSDFVFLRDFFPGLLKYHEEGGSFVGLGPCCSTNLEDLATTVFPIRGNASLRGQRLGDEHGSVYSLSESLDEISGGMPSSFIVTQEKISYQSGVAGAIDPFVPAGDLTIVYREETTGIPLLVAFETPGGGRTVSFPGCYVVSVDRLPFYWGNLVGKEEFRQLLKNSVQWAMEGNGRFNTLYPDLDDALQAEGERAHEMLVAGEDARAKEATGRLLTLVAIWTAALIFQAILSVKFIVPRLR